jgi:hypothetical protein
MVLCPVSERFKLSQAREQFLQAVVFAEAFAQRLIPLKAEEMIGEKPEFIVAALRFIHGPFSFNRQLGNL